MRRTLGAIALACCIAVAAPGTAGAARGLTTGFADPLFTDGRVAERDAAFDDAAAAGAGIARINLLWRTATPARPADPTNPADPAYDFSLYDAAVRAAAARGMEPMLTIYRAPEWAESPGRPQGTPGGSWKPQPQAYAEFALAVARRYSGSFADASGTLPRVRLFQAWNEPNLSPYLNPQYENGAPVAPAVYRDLLNAFYGAVKQVHGDNTVITGGTAPYGDPPGGDRTRPLAFMRDMLCMSGRKKPKPVACPSKPSFDVLAHHPINTSGGPRTSALNPDDSSTPDFGDVRKTLRAAEKAGQTGGPKRHELWATEIWWETDPPDTTEGQAPATQAKWIQQALYLLWKEGARAVINLQVRDTPFSQAIRFADTATGVVFVDGTRKPSFTAIRFPFVSDRRDKRTVRVWGRSPVGGKLVVERRSGGSWKRLDRISVNAGEVFKSRVRVRGRANLRARVGGETSLTWNQRK